MTSRSIVYVDGFNLYYGALKGTAWKWLDLERYFRMLRSEDDIQAIKYFTALIDGDHLQHQEAYLSAMASHCPRLRIILGKFKHKRVKCSVGDCRFQGSRWFEVPEEKRTDVNIGVHMMVDALTDACDRIVLVSGDSDLVPALTMVKQVAPLKKLFVYVPASNPVRGAAVELRAVADKHRTLPANLFPRAQLPARVPDGAGGWISKPESW